MTRQQQQTAATPSIQTRRVQSAAAAGSAVSTLTHFRLGGHRVMLSVPTPSVQGYENWFIKKMFNQKKTKF
jgi:hypothetical protein